MEFVHIEETINVRKSFEDFGYFRLYVTDRNWVGEKFVTKEDTRSFLNRLRGMNEFFFDIYKHKLNGIRIDILIDCSYFSTQLEEDRPVKRFLREIEQNLHLLEDPRVLIEWKRKLRFYAGSPENYALLYHFCKSNSHLQISSEIAQYIEMQVYENGEKAVKSVIKKDYKRLAKELFEEELEFDYIIDRLSASTDRRLKDDSLFISRLFKFAMQDPRIFLYNILFIKQFYKPTYKEELFQQLFIRIQNEKRDNCSVTVEVIDQEQESENKINTDYCQDVRDNGEPMLMFFKNDPPSQVYSEKKDILTTIGKWVKQRLKAEDLKNLPIKSWIHFIKDQHQIRQDVGLLIIRNVSRIAGRLGDEYLFIAEGLIRGPESITPFPVIDPDSWVHLNQRQCAVLCYLICLIHDICKEKNYTIYEVSDDKLGAINILEIGRDGTEEKNGTRKISNPQTKQRITTEGKERHKKQNHWVSFHFRRLRKSENPSTAAIEKAKAYGIHNIPRGFTFVESFTRGSVIGERKISAIDVYRRTMQRFEHVGQEAQPS
ncbi:hypothetical protein [Paenibacillus abyssi]|uniref:Uncharacterized protein n=1 Tax=Paenibacillus abyssi TaxID=1340531 RepID=A0A917G1L2_9BACL|nr:hypothetical protein [Paenibacillus abyssi]GGG18016.1 hypothetical protein GCM10010916_38490 [Paenibacillus abyssi]